jgi:ribosomal protein S18 acetylase RimI-like enzyme
VSDFEIRRSAPGDEHKLIQLMLDYIVGFYAQPEPAHDDLIALIQRLFDGGDGVQFVAQAGQDLAGFATVYFTWSTLSVGPAAIMNDLFVAEEWRGSDAAKELLTACAGAARERGCTALTWETAHDNLRAQRFYERNGGRRESWVVYELDL